MATKTIAWESGSGYITLTYTGVGNAPISVESDANELFEDRQQTVQIVTTDGSPQKAVSLLVRQKGKTYPVGTVFNFGYTGSVQEITLPRGKYKLQCWGAQGGSVSGSYTATGSKGGYSEGVLTITEPTTIYVFVGGQGTSSSTSSTSGTANGGWNGGGASVRYASYQSGDTYGESYPRPGGGSTDMCLVTSTMNYLSGRTDRNTSSLLSRFIVAGGGAGASAAFHKEDKPIIESLNVQAVLEQGTWKESVGCKDSASNPYRIRSNSALEIIKGDRYTIEVNSGYQIFLIFFSSFVSNAEDYAGNIVSFYKTFSQSKEFVAAFEHVAIVIKKDSGASISPSDNHGLRITHYYYTDGIPAYSISEMNFTVEQGTWSEVYGHRSVDTSPYHLIRLRSNTAINIAKGKRYIVYTKYGYTVFLIFLSKFTSNNIGTTDNTVGEYYTWNVGYEFIAEYDYMAVVIRKGDGLTVTPSDDHGLQILEFNDIEHAEEITYSSQSTSSQQGGGTSGRGQYPGTQNSAGSGGEFGLGANQTTTNYRYDAGAGGGGWYGGGTSYSDTNISHVNYSGGGSGFVNTAGNAGYRPSGHTGLQLDSGSTQDGYTSFASPSGGNETGHSGDGYARITVIE